MAFGRVRTISIGLSMVFLSITLQSCGVIEDALRALGRICDQPELVVTKSVDTDDGVCTADDCSLREAVITANACPGPQTIRVPIGIYALTLTGADEDEARRGDLDIRDDVTIIGGPTSDTPAPDGAHVVEIRGRFADRIFDIAPSRDLDRLEPVNVRLEHLIIREGRALHGGGVLNRGTLGMTLVSMMNNEAVLPDGVGGEANGGGLYNQDNGTLDFDTVTFYDNAADNGGGLYMQSGVVMWESFSVVQNAASQKGGGLYVGYGAEATLNDVEFTANEAGEEGGGIYNEGMLTIHALYLAENEATANGGGLFNSSLGETIIEDSWFTSNNANWGGAVYNEGLLQIYQTGINGNTAFGGQGGGLANVRNPLFPASDPHALLRLRNVTVSGNMLGTPSTPGGAGLYNEGGSLQIEFSTFAHNSPDGVFSTGGPEIGIRSSIFASQYDNCSGVSGASGGYNVDDAETCGFTLVSDQPNTDPRLMPLASYGGISLSHALQVTSPAVDAGDPDRCLPTDQRGVSRPQGARCDAGAFELEPGGIAPPPMPGDTEPTAIEPTPTPTPTAAPAEPMTMNFNADSYSIIAGACTRLRWEVKNAGEVRLDGEVVEALAARQVCPQTTTTYRLVGTAGDEQLAGQVTIEVTAPQVPPAAPEKLAISNRVCTDQAYSVSLSWIDKADNEDGYRVFRAANLVATLGPNATTFTDNPPGSGPYTYGVEAFNSVGVSARPTVQEAGCLY
jgi:CSLREA domain-containing protein